MLRPNVAANLAGYMSVHDTHPSSYQQSVQQSVVDMFCSRSRARLRWSVGRCSMHARALWQVCCGPFERDGMPTSPILINRPNAHNCANIRVVYRQKLQRTAVSRLENRLFTYHEQVEKEGTRTRQSRGAHTQRSVHARRGGAQ